MENMFLDGFGLSNFKCFKDEIKIAQRPITINIGPNNSGKSSLLKAINLFQHSLFKNSLIHNNANQNMLGEIDSFQLLNFGMPENYLNDPTKELSFRLPILFEETPVWLINKNVEIKFHYLFEKQFQYNVDFTNLLRVEKRENAPPGLGKLNKYQIIIDNHLYFELTRNLQIENIYNGTEFGYFGELKIYPLNFIKQNDVNCIKIPLEIPTRKFHDIEYVQDIVTESLLKIGNIDAENIGYLVNSGLDSIYNFQNCISKIKFIDLNRREYGRYFDVTKSSLFKDFFEFYFNRQNSNIAKIKNFMRKILPLFNLPSEIEISQIDNIGFTILLIDEKGNKRNIIDYGSAVNQILPLLLYYSTKINNTIDFNTTTLKHEYKYLNSLIVVEEPESNLHPAMQSKLADMISILNKEYKLDFIIETHSEYLIRRFQILIANKQLDQDDIVINYFWKNENNNERKCKQIYFDQDGKLSDSFEKGFYDEGLSIQLELLKQNSIN